MAEKSMESLSSTSLAAEGAPVSGTLRRIDPSHRAPILVRIPNVHQPQQPSIGFLARCQAAVMKVLNFLLPAVRPENRKPEQTDAPESLHAVALETASPAVAAVVAAIEPAPLASAAPIVAPASPTVAVEPPSVAPPANSPLAEKVQRIARVVQALVWLRSNPTMAVPGLVASVLGFCGMLHMMLSSETPTEVDSGPEVFLGSPVGDTGVPPLGAATLQPVNPDGNMSAPTDRMVDEAAPPYTPYGSAPQDSQGPVLGPAMPGVARLKGRIEPLTPTVDSRNDQDRQGIR